MYTYKYEYVYIQMNIMVKTLQNDEGGGEEYNRKVIKARKNKGNSESIKKEKIGKIVCNEIEEGVLKVPVFGFKIALYGKVY
jgi:hypothetical protein